MLERRSLGILCEDHRSGINGNSRLADVQNLPVIGRLARVCIWRWRRKSRDEKQIRGRRWFKVKEKFVAKDADRIARAILRSATLVAFTVRQVWPGSPPFSLFASARILSLSAAHKSRRVSPNKPMGSFLILRGPMRFQDISISSFVHSLVLCPSNNSFYTSWQLLRHVGGFYIFFYSKY